MPGAFKPPDTPSARAWDMRATRDPSEVPTRLGSFTFGLPHLRTRTICKNRDFIEISRPVVGKLRTNADRGYLPSR
jgi:hypothetical protein